MTTSPNELLNELLSGPDARNLTSNLLARAEQLFQQHGDAARARWMRLEREGYGARTEPADLAELLGRDATNDLTRAVLRSRLQHGRVVVGGVARQWPHFFVESVDELRRWEERVGAGGAAMISIELDVPEDAAAPQALSFPRSVFGQVLDRIAIELADALRATKGGS